MSCSSPRSSQYCRDFILPCPCVRSTLTLIITLWDGTTGPGASKPHIAKHRWPLQPLCQCRRSHSSQPHVHSRIQHVLISKLTSCVAHVHNTTSRWEKVQYLSLRLLNTAWEINSFTYRRHPPMMAMLRPRGDRHVKICNGCNCTCGFGLDVTIPFCPQASANLG